MFNNVFTVNNWRDILDCSCKWLCLTLNRRISPKPLLLFRLNGDLFDFVQLAWLMC